MKKFVKHDNLYLEQIYKEDYVENIIGYINGDVIKTWKDNANMSNAFGYMFRKFGYMG